MKWAEYIQCRNCGDEVTPDSEFCPHCGSLFSAAGSVKCDEHPEIDAEGICVVCRALCCAKCGKEVHGKFLCADHREVEVQQDWARVFQSTDINESTLVRAFLDSNGFKVLVQNFNSVSYVWDGPSDSSLARSALNRPAKVFVPIPEYLKAVEVLREWESGSIKPDEKV